MLYRVLSTFTFSLFLTCTSLYAQAPLVDKVDQVLAEVDTMRNDSLAIRTLLSQSGRLQYAKNTIKLIDRAEEITDSYPDKKMEIHVSYAKGNYYMRQDKMDMALKIYDEGLSHPEIDALPDMKSLMLGGKSTSYKNQGKMDQALNLILESRKVYYLIDTTGLSPSDQKRHIGRGAILDNSIANSYLNLKDYDNAIKFFDISYKKLSSLGDDFLAGVIVMNKAVVYIEQDAFAEAKKTTKEAIKLLDNDKRSSSRHYYMASVNLADAHLGLDEIDEAKVIYSSSMEKYSDLELSSIDAQALLGLGRVELEDKNHSKAYSYCDQAQKKLSDLDDIAIKTKICECNYLSAKALGRYDVAMLNLETFKSLSDSIFNENNIRNVTKLEMQFEFDKENELKDIETANTARHNKQVVIGLSAGLLALLVTALLLYRLIRIRRKAALQLKEKNEIVSKALSEKEILLREIHHRVKNNLQIISSLLGVQSRKIDDPKAQEAIQEGRNRVRSMALIHKNLYQDENLVGVSSSKYIEELLEELVSNYQVDDGQIAIKKDIDSIVLDVDSIIPLGLILNELITNSLKYAFSDMGRAEIFVSLKKTADQLVLKVKDNGKGLPEDFNISESKSMGYTLVRAFTDKLEGTLNIASDKGTSVVISIPNSELNYMNPPIVKALA